MSEYLYREDGEAPISIDVDTKWGIDSSLIEVGRCLFGCSLRSKNLNETINGHLITHQVYSRKLDGVCTLEHGAAAYNFFLDVLICAHEKEATGIIWREGAKFAYSDDKTMAVMYCSFFNKDGQVDV